MVERRIARRGRSSPPTVKPASSSSKVAPPATDLGVAPSTVVSTHTATPTLVDLFSGCGGASLGFKAAGFKVSGAVELDPLAAESYELNLGISPLIKDVRALDGQELLRTFDLRKGELTCLLGCTPCQGFSRHRGDGAGRDPRNRLLDDFIELVLGMLPLFVAFENVPVLLIGPGRWRLQQAITKLRRASYEVRTEVVQAADYGVPQKRRRLLLVASRVGNGVPWPVPTHGAPDSARVLRGELAPWRTVQDAIGDLPRLRSGQTSASDALHCARTHSKVALERMAHIRKDGGGRFDLPKNLELKCHRDHDGHKDVYGRMWWSRPAPTLTGGCTNITRGRFIHPAQNRAITDREALLLQGFPSFATVVGTAGQRALQIGNAVPPPLTEAVAKAVLAQVSVTTKTVG